MARTRLLVIVGVILLVVGILGLVYEGMSFQRTESHKLGPLEVKVPTEDRVTIPKWLAWTLCGAGAISVAAGLWGRKFET